VVVAAAAAFKQNGKTPIKLTGYTDTSGSARSNLALSKAPAETVRSTLVQLGVPRPTLASHGNASRSARADS